MKQKHLILKALVFPFVFAIILYFSACNKLVIENNPPPVIFPDSYTADIVLGEFSGKADISYESYESFKMTFFEPESIKGFTIRLENSVYSYEVYGVTAERRENDAPQNAVPTLIFSALRVLMKGEYAGAAKIGEEWHYEGMSAGNVFLAKQDDATGRLKELSIASAGMSVIFS